VRQRADARNTIGPPKSEAGERTIPIPPATLAALKEWKKKCPRRRGELDYAFPNGDGNVENHANIVTRGLAPTLIDAGIGPKYTGLHALHYYFASWCINRPPIGLGLSLKEVQVRMGHSNIAVTADTSLSAGRRFRGDGQRRREIRITAAISPI
jgi:integrase